MRGLNGSIGPLMPVVLTTKFIFDTDRGLGIVGFDGIFGVQFAKCDFDERK